MKNWFVRLFHEALVDDHYQLSLMSYYSIVVVVVVDRRRATPLFYKSNMI